MTQQQLCNRAAVVDKHIPSASWPLVSALVSWSAFNAGMARTGVGLVDKLATQAGWNELQTILGLDNYDATEAGALSLTATAVATSIDLAAAAALRLAGAVPSRSPEFSMSTFTDRRDRQRVASHPLPPTLDTWATSIRSSAEWDLLKNCRDQAVHRTASRVVYGTTLSALPSSEVSVDGRNYPIDGLVLRFSAFGEATFAKFCDAVLADFPNQVR